MTDNKFDDQDKSDSVGGSVGTSEEWDKELEALEELDAIEEESFGDWEEEIDDEDPQDDDEPTEEPDDPEDDEPQEKTQRSARSLILPASAVLFLGLASFFILSGSNDEAPVSSERVTNQQQNVGDTSSLPSLQEPVSSEIDAGSAGSLAGSDPAPGGLEASRQVTTPSVIPTEPVTDRDSGPSYGEAPQGSQTEGGSDEHSDQGGDERSSPGAEGELMSYLQRIESRLAEMESSALRRGDLSSIEHKISSVQSRVEEVPATQGGAETDGRSRASTTEEDEPSAIEDQKADQDKKRALISGRKRLPGTQVVDVSDSGEMSIVKSTRTSNPSISVFFEGESIVLRSEGITETVSNVELGGWLVLVGEDYYMDDELEPFKRKMETTTINIEANPKPGVASGDRQRVRERNQEPDDRPKPRVRNNPSGFIEGWAAKGTGETGHILMSPNGSWVLAAPGSEVSDIGVVGDRTSEGHIQTTKGLIRRSDD